MCSLDQLPRELWAFDDCHFWKLRRVNKFWYKEAWAAMTRIQAKPNITGQQINLLLSKAKNLTDLSLVGCSKLDGRNIAALRCMPNLISLDLRSVFKRNRAERDKTMVREIGTLTNLQYLQLSTPWTTEPTAIYLPPSPFWDPLTNLQKLSHLSLNYCFDYCHAPLLSTLTNLQYLEFKLFSSLDEFPVIFDVESECEDYSGETESHDLITDYINRQESYKISALRNLPLLHSLVCDISSCIDNSISMDFISELRSLQYLSCVFDEHSQPQHLDRFCDIVLQSTKLNQLNINAPDLNMVKLAEHNSLSNLWCFGPDPMSPMSFHMTKLQSLQLYYYFDPTCTSQPLYLGDFSSLTSLSMTRISFHCHIQGWRSMELPPSLLYFNGKNVHARETQTLPITMLFHDRVISNRKVCPGCRSRRTKACRETCDPWFVEK